MKRQLVGIVVLAWVAGCGLPDTGLAQDGNAQEQLQTAALRRRGDFAQRDLRPERALPAPTALSLQAQPRLHVEQFAAADGTRVKFLLGMIGCGILVVADGDAVVQGGRFEVPFDPAQNPNWGPLELFIHVDSDGDGVCSEEGGVLTVPDVTVADGTVVDASGAQQTYAGCWIFQGWGG